MPQVFKIGSYWIYFWLDENMPLEPVHVHVSQGKPVPNGTKIWITKNHRCSLAHNKSKIPPVILNNIIRIIEMRIPEIEKKLELFFICYSCLTELIFFNVSGKIIIRLKVISIRIIPKPVVHEKGIQMIIIKFKKIKYYISKP